MKSQQNRTLAEDSISQRLAAVFESQAGQAGQRSLPAEESSTTSQASQGVYRTPAEWIKASEVADSLPLEIPAQETGVDRLHKVWDFTRSHLVAVGMILLTGCLWAGYSITQASSSEVTLAAPSATPSVSATAIPNPSMTPSPPPKIEVHIIGSVQSPGVVSVPLGARVKDVIAAAGGLSDLADPAELNLAEVVVDGSQILIGSKTSPKGEIRLPAATSTGGGGLGAKVSLNTATLEQLESLPGVGPVTAQRILTWRTQHSKFTAVEELQEIEGIGAKTFASLVDYVQL